MANNVFFNNLPTAIQAAIQQGYLDRTFKKGLTAKLGFRAIADKMAFPGGIGQTITDTKPGLLPPATKPLGIRADMTDLRDGLLDSVYPMEQYTIGVSQYAQTMTLNLASASQAIDSLYLQNAYALGESANRTLDILAYNALFNAYMGGNTRVNSRGATGATVHVDDVRGFFELTDLTTSKVTKVSANNNLTVTIGANQYLVQSVVADGFAGGGASAGAVDYTFANLDFANSANAGLTNISTVSATGGISGVLTLTSNIITGDDVAGTPVMASHAPLILRPRNGSGVMYNTAAGLVGGAYLNLRMIQQATAQMRANGINSQLWCFLTDQQLATLWQDGEFRQYLQGAYTSPEFRDLNLIQAMGINFVTNNIAAIDTQTLGPSIPIHRAIVVAEGALVEADFTSRAYANGLQDDVSEVALVDNVAHITRPPLNLLADVINQSWSSYIGFCAPTDLTANPTVIPTSSNAARKRAVILESVVT